MKTIKFTTSVAGARFAYGFDEEVTLEDRLAEGFIKDGLAVEVRAPGPAVLRRRRGTRATETTTLTGADEHR